MSVPVSLHFNMVAVGQLLILVYHFQYPCFFSVCVSHLCTLPSPHLLKAGEVSLLQARLFVCISSSVSAPLPLLYLQTCLLFLWTWLFLCWNYVPAFQRMDCSEGTFLSLTAVHIHPNVSVLTRQEPTKPFCMSYLTLWIIWGLPGRMSLFQLHSLMFLLTHEYNHI